MGFTLSKVFWAFFSPGNIFVLLLLLGGFLVTAKSESWRDLGRRLCFDVAFLLFFLAVFPVGDWLLAPLENRFPPETPSHVDGIILLGGDENPHLTELRGQPIIRDSASRYIRFASLARQYPQAKLVFSGGSGLLVRDSKMTDAEVAKQGLTDIGIAADRITFEDASRNTYENALKTKEIMRPTPQQNWLLVTSAWHMPRAIAVFRKAGWNVYPAPSDYETGGTISSRPRFDLEEHLRKFTLAMHEYYGLIAYKLMGCTDTLWPK